MRARSSMWALVLALTAAVAIGCGGKKGEPEDGGEDGGKSEPVQAAARPGTVRLTADALSRAHLLVEPARSLPLRHRVEATGEIVFDEKRVAVAFSRVDGFVEEALAFLDDPVRAGQPLATLYCPEFLLAQNEYLQARHRAEVACARSVAGDCGTARKILRSADGKLRVLGLPESEISALARTGRARSSHSIVSPITGRVVESHVIKGSSVKAGDPLFKVADLSRLWLDVDLFERDLGKVARGNEVEARTTAFPERVFRGRLILVGGIVDERKRTLRARAEMDNAEGLLRPGMFVDVRLLGDAGAGAAEALTVPEGAVQTIDGSPTVFVEERPGIYQRREVRVGEAEEGLVPVLEGLREGERVVAAGSFILKAELLKGSLEE